MTKIKKKHKALKIIIIVSAILIVLLGVMRYLFGNKEVMFGANVNSMSYSKDISPQNYSSVDEEMKNLIQRRRYVRLKIMVLFMCMCKG